MFGRLQFSIRYCDGALMITNIQTTIQERLQQARPNLVIIRLYWSQLEDAQLGIELIEEEGGDDDSILLSIRFLLPIRFLLLVRFLSTRINGCS